MTASSADLLLKAKMSMILVAVLLQKDSSPPPAALSLHFFTFFPSSSSQQRVLPFEAFGSLHQFFIWLLSVNAKEINQLSLMKVIGNLVNFYKSHQEQTPVFSTDTSPRSPFSYCLINSPYSPHSAKDFFQVNKVVSTSPQDLITLANPPKEGKKVHRSHFFLTVLLKESLPFGWYQKTLQK